MLEVILVIYIVLIFMLIFKIKKRMDILKPDNIIVLGYILFIIPYLVIYYFDETYLHTRVFLHLEYKGKEFSIIKYIYISLITLGSFYIGSKIKLKSNYAIKNGISKEKIIIRSKKIIGFAILNFLIIIYLNGGFYNYYINMSNRTGMLRGLGIFLTFMSFLKEGVLFYIFNNTSRIKNIIILCITFLVYSFLGGRSGALGVLVLVFLYEIVQKKFKNIINIKILLILLCVMIYIVVFPILRVQTGNSNNFQVIDLFLNNFSKIISEIKATYIDIFIYNYFENNNYWLGASFKDFLPSFLPSVFYKYKPPVDDGVYIWNLVLGNIVKPSMPFKDLDASSWPMGTTAFAYVNFGVIGVIIFNIFKGFISRVAYNLMRNSDYNLPSFIFYWTILNLSFSNLFVVRFIFLVIINWLPLIYIYKLKLIKIIRK